MKNAFLGLALFALVSCSTAEKTNSQNAGQSSSSTESTAESTGVPSLKIVSPIENEVIKWPDVPVKFDLKNYHVEPNGQHIHVIVDNEPYQPCYNVSEPFVVKGLKPGMHTLRAFPSRAWHESLKNPEAFASVTFYVSYPTKDQGPDFATAPMLTYSRPKGKYEGEKATKILFDFWLKNVTLSPNGYRVRYILDHGRPQLIDQWKPSYFEGLKNGKHKLVVELIDKNGKLVKGPYNHTEREFEVAR